MTEADMERAFTAAIVLARKLRAKGVSLREQGVQMGRLLRDEGFTAEEGARYIPRIVTAVMQERRH